MITDTKPPIQITPSYTADGKLNGVHLGVVDEFTGKVTQWEYTEVPVSIADIMDSAQKECDDEQTA